jgi:hypothetical protein
MAKPCRGKRGAIAPPSSYSFLLSIFNKENSMHGQCIYIYIYIYNEAAHGFEKRVGLPSSYIFDTCAIRDFTCIGVWLWLLFKVFFVPTCIKMIFFILKKLFLRSAHQNNLKHTKFFLNFTSSLPNRSTRYGSSKNNGSTSPKISY